MKKTLYILFSFIFLTVSCQRDKDVLIELALFPSVQINSDLGGQVVDANNSPIANATIKLNSESLQTDENGIFTFYNANVNSKRATLEISKSGYFTTTRAIIPQDETTVLTKIELIEKVVVGELESSQGGNLTMTNGTNMVIPADVLTDIHGNDFNGQVKVVAEYLDLDASGTIKKMPGDMKAKNINDEDVLLEIFSLMVIEMKDDFDQTLKIASNENIQVSLPMPSSITGNVPSDLSLWYFDLEENVWKEKAAAALENDKLVSTTNELSFLAIAKAHEAVIIKGKLTSQTGKTLSNMPVTLKVQDGGIVSANYTGVDGVLQSEVPKELSLEVNIIDNCGDNIYNAFIGGYVEDLYIIDVPISRSEDFFGVSAKVMSCTNENLKNGYVLLEISSREYTYPIADGIFEADINTCNNATAKITAFDINNNQQSEVISIEIVDLVDLGEVKTCL